MMVSYVFVAVIYFVFSISCRGVPVGFTQCSKKDLDRRVKEGLASCLFDVPQKVCSVF